MNKYIITEEQLIDGQIWKITPKDARDIRSHPYNLQVKQDIPIWLMEIIMREAPHDGYISSRSILKRIKELQQEGEKK